MKDVVDKCSTKGCAIDVGSIIDNEDCVWRVEKNFASREEAESTIAAVANVPKPPRPPASRRRSTIPSWPPAMRQSLRLRLPSPARRKRSFSNCR
jgi:hypothetical protein